MTGMDEEGGKELLTKSNVHEKVKRKLIVLKKTKKKK